MSILRFFHPLLLLLPIANTAIAQEPTAPRLPPMPHEEHGYSGFDSVVIATRSDCDAFLTSIMHGVGWNNRPAFVAALAGAKVDFGRESLILLRHTEGSGSVQVAFARPEVKGRRVVCRIDRTAQDAGTADVVHYCFAVVVSTADVEDIELRVQGRPTIVLPIHPVTGSP